MDLSADLLCEVKIKVSTWLLTSLGAVVVITERKLRMTDAEGIRKGMRIQKEKSKCIAAYDKVAKLRTIVGLLKTFCVK